VVDGSHIYYLERKKPVIIPIQKNHPKLVASDGFHHSRPVQVDYRQQRTRYYKVGCIIEDDQLIVGLVVLAIIYGMGFSSDLMFMKILSFVPILYFLYRYYIRRKEFLQIRPS
jgi:hypothetical protein